MTYGYPIKSILQLNAKILDMIYSAWIIYYPHRSINLPTNYCNQLIIHHMRDQWHQSVAPDCSRLSIWPTKPKDHSPTITHILDQPSVCFSSTRRVSQRIKATIHQLATMLCTSKNVLFPGHNHLLTTRADDPTL